MYHIQGSISEDLNGQYVKLFQLQGDTLLISADSVMIHHGKFNFSGTENIDNYAILAAGRQPRLYSVELILEKGNIKVEMPDDKPNIAYGTYLNDLHHSLRDTCYIKWKEGEIKLEDGLIAYSPEKEKEYATMVYHIMQQQSRNIVGHRFITEYKDKLPTDSLISMYNYLESIQKNNPWISHWDIAFRKRNEEEQEKQTASIGNTYTDFELYTPNVKLQKISDYVGKSPFTFIDFWASWCSPCIAEIPKLKEIYEEYKDKGVTFLSFSTIE